MSEVNPIPELEESTEGDDDEHSVPTDLLDLHVALEAKEAGLL